MSQTPTTDSVPRVDVDPTKPLLSVKHLKQYFKIPGGNVVKAVDDISLTLCLVKPLV